MSALAVLVQHIDPTVLTALRILTSGLAVLIISKVIGIFRLPTKID